MAAKEVGADRASAASAETPLSVAVSERDRDVMAMVERAVRTKNVQLAYQPVVSSAAPDTPAFFEALVRVLDDTGRTIPARSFVGALERHELGRVIDCLALELGLRALTLNPRLKLSVNMSARSIGYRPWLKHLEEELARTPSISGRLVLEISEASAMLMPDVVQGFMTGLQDRGVTFALDDFGAGYTSFRYLKTLSFDILKIDGQFIRGVNADPDNQVLVQALVDIGRHFDMFTVAESVETAREVAFLRTVGVDLLQGHFFGAPTLKPGWSVVRPDEVVV